MQDAANKKTLEIFASKSKKSAGPCLSVIYDPITGEISYGQNFKTTLSELYLQNIDLTKAYKTGKIVPKPRCENCRYLTDGINTLNHN